MKLINIDTEEETTVSGQNLMCFIKEKNVDDDDINDILSFFRQGFDVVYYCEDPEMKADNVDTIMFNTCRKSLTCLRNAYL